MTTHEKTAIVLINLGSPDSPKPRDVHRYLTEFLNDPRVIDMGWLARKILVNGIIVPLRYRKSAAVYRALWTENGSPLIHHGNQVKHLLQQRFDVDSQKIFLAMRYQNPSMESVMETIREWGPDHVVVVPLFPQYASASTGSVLEKCMKILSTWWVVPQISMVSQFYHHPLFIGAFIDRGEQYNWREYDHVLFSYHGLPERHVDKVYRDNACRNHDCETELNAENQHCYKATCYATTRMIAQQLGMAPDDYTVCFQSRLGKGWIEPFSDHVIAQMGKDGKKKLLVFSPAFVADCLETIVEIGVEYQEIFEKHGGHKIQLVPSLNDSTIWIDALEHIVRGRMGYSE